MPTSNEILTIGNVIFKTAKFLQEKGLPNPRLEADLLLGEVLNFSRVKLYSDWDRPLEPAEVRRYRELILKRVQGMPLAYLVGKKSFLSWEFLVTPDVLIPRPETELLVEAVCERVKPKSVIRGIDLGTGSGVIVIALAKLLPMSSWIAIDISSAALAVAQENAKRLGVTEQIEFLHGDLLTPVNDLNDSFDVIVSNPPYIPTKDLAELQLEVKQEPVLALDGGVDGLEPYRNLLPLAAKLLKPEGLLAVEHGYQQRQSLTELFTAAGLNCENIQDLAGWDRILIGKKSSGFDVNCY